MKDLIKKIEHGVSIEEYHYILSSLDCCIVETIFPKSIKGLTIKNEYDTGHVVYINTMYSKRTQRSALMHELMHIYNSDFENGKSLFLKEQNFNNVQSI
ncbi:MAG: hypothetical protein FD141_396 [Fusobacteria bacterium]|nr:MAG: hypothetical protein FD141_396 [Fusobacteriota bacterium]KAF0228939.1 MAG: hypothetical protein FD182_1195 [Fusobacteriota bacterium]